MAYTLQQEAVHPGALLQVPSEWLPEAFRQDIGPANMMSSSEQTRPPSLKEGGGIIMG